MTYFRNSIYFFFNACAHGERLFIYRIIDSIPNLIVQHHFLRNNQLFVKC